MVPSYQTVPLANVPTKANGPKEERASNTPVPRRKQVAVAAMMVGMALVVVGYSYGSNTHPSRKDDRYRNDDDDDDDGGQPCSWRCSK